MTIVFRGSEFFYSFFYGLAAFPNNENGMNR